MVDVDDGGFANLLNLRCLLVAFMYICARLVLLR